MQKKMVLSAAVAATVVAFVAGCNKAEPEATEQQAQETMTQSAQMTGVESDVVALPPLPRDTDVIVSVGDVKMTWAELSQRVEALIAGVTAKSGRAIPSEELPRVKQMVRRDIVQNFVMENLIRLGAAREGVVLDDAYRAAELAEIEATTGKKFEEVAAEYPEGVERARELFDCGLLEKRLLEEKVFSKIVITDEEVKATVEKATAEAALAVAKMDEFAQQCAADPAAFETLVTTESAIKEPMARSDADYQRIFGAAWTQIAALKEGEISPVLDVEGLKIMVKFVKLTPAVTEESAKQVVDELYARATAGEDFAALAAANSACPSGQRGGDLGTFGKGQMVPEFEQAAFTQEIGKIGAPVKTQFGYHLILVTERDEAQGTVRASHILVAAKPDTRSLSLLALPVPEVPTEAAVREEMMATRKRQAAGAYFEELGKTLGVTSTLFPELSMPVAK